MDTGVSHQTSVQEPATKGMDVDFEDIRAVSFAGQGFGGDGAGDDTGGTTGERIKEEHGTEKEAGFTEASAESRQKPVKEEPDEEAPTGFARDVVEDRDIHRTNSTSLLEAVAVGQEAGADQHPEHPVETADDHQSEPVLEEQPVAQSRDESNAASLETRKHHAAPGEGPSFGNPAKEYYQGQSIAQANNHATAPGDEQHSHWQLSQMEALRHANHPPPGYIDQELWDSHQDQQSTRQPYRRSLHSKSKYGEASAYEAFEEMNAYVQPPTRAVRNRAHPSEQGMVHGQHGMHPYPPQYLPGPSNHTYDGGYFQHGYHMPYQAARSQRSLKRKATNDEDEEDIDTDPEYEQSLDNEEAEDTDDDEPLMRRRPRYEDGAGDMGSVVESNNDLQSMSQHEGGSEEQDEEVVNPADARLLLRQKQMAAWKEGSVQNMPIQAPAQVPPRANNTLSRESIPYAVEYTGVQTPGTASVPLERIPHLTLRRPLRIKIPSLHRPLPVPQSQILPQASPSDGISFKLPPFNVELLPLENSEDVPKVKVSLPGMVREVLLLSTDHAAQEIHLLQNLFIPGQQALDKPDPQSTYALLNFHTVCTMVLEAFVAYELGDEVVGAKRPANSDEGNDAREADSDEIFFAVIDRWRVGLAEATPKPAYALIRGVQEFCDIALDIIYYIKEHGFIEGPHELRKERSDKGSKRVKKEDDGKGGKGGKSVAKSAAAKAGAAQKKEKAAVGEKRLGRPPKAATAEATVVKTKRGVNTLSARKKAKTTSENERLGKVEVTKAARKESVKRATRKKSGGREPLGKVDVKKAKK